MPEPVVLTFGADEALVLFELIARINKEEGVRFVDQAEERVLWDLEASLERVLVEPLTRDYRQSIEQARARVRDE